MRIARYAFFLIILIVFGVKAESEGYRQWLKRRDALKADDSVARYYTFEDVVDSKSTVKDLSGNGGDLIFKPYKDRNTGEVFEDVQVVEGRWPEKKAVRLDRGFYQGPTFNVEKNKFTAEAWFRKKGPGSILPASNLRNGHILSVSGYRKGWRLVVSYDPVSAITFSIGMPSGPDKAASTIRADAPVPENTWHHIAATWDGKHMKLYLNGELIGDSLFNKDYIPVEEPELFNIGYAKLGIGTLLMDIDEVAIYDRVLTAEEIEKLSEGPEGISTEDVFARADAFVEKQDYASARKEYEKLKGMPNYGKELALFNMAESYRLEKDYARAHETYEEIMSLPGLTVFYRIYALFRQAEVCLEQKDYNRARQLYGQVKNIKGALRHHVFKAGLYTGDAYKSERNHSRARDIYEGLLIQEENMPFPNDGYRVDLRDRLEEIEGLADGTEAKSVQERRFERINAPEYAIFVSPEGSDENPGTKDSPFATIKRAQEEVRRLKAKGMPRGGISVNLREGRYFLTEGIVFDSRDSGSEDAPVVYRSYPGEEARLIGGRQLTNFRLLEDPDILNRLPEDGRGNVWVADLKKEGITQYGQLLNRGYGQALPGAMELIFNGKVMTLARWPNNGWVRIAGLTEVDGVSRDAEYQLGKFIYEGNRPERWTEEKDAWVKGYLGVNQPYILLHRHIKSIDTKGKTIRLSPVPEARQPETRVAKNHPYHVYNLLSELDRPGEWYLDRETGKLYFYPPDEVKNSEVIVTTLDETLVSFNGASHVALYGLVIEGTWRHGAEIHEGRNNLVAGSTIRNTGQWAVKIKGGWDHAVVGCDIYDTGEGGISLDFEELRSRLIPGRKKLIPARHTVENNHIHRFNRFDGGYRQAVQIDGVGQRVSHNVIHDSPHQMIYFNANDHVVEYNELHDGPYEGREIGAMYIYGEPWYLMSRGTVIRNNFFHHISVHSSPNLTHGLNGVHIDAMNAGLVLTQNIFYKVPNGISSTYPGNYLTNNIFVDVENRGIGQSDRSNIFCKDRDINAGPNMRIMARMERQLTSVRYKQPTWSYRYPPLVGMMEVMPSRWGSIQGSIIERNINTGGRFITFSRGMRSASHFENNWDGQDPLFKDREHMNFSPRPGAPVYGLTGCEPIDMDNIGVYRDKLRRSWPIDRTPEDIGKYYNTDWSAVGEMKATMKAVKRVSPALTYSIPPRKSPVKIDGSLDEREWLGLEKDKAMVINRYYTGEEKKGPATYAWLLYDKDYLYIATRHEADPWSEGMTEKAKDHMPMFEVSIESQMGPHSQGWWMEDMQTGPIYVIWGYFDGKLEVKNNFKMSFEQVKTLEEAIVYKDRIINKAEQVWTSEMKIPLEKIGIDPAGVDRLAFNIGVAKKAGWFAWVPTGASIWRIENAGFIEFSK